MTARSEWETAKEQVRDRIDFVGLVEEYVNLEERGKGYWGLCPFHTEDTPSFSVTPSMGIFKCFGCEEGGDVFDFYMNIENCDFKEALRRLSDRVDVELPSPNETADNGGSQSQRLREICTYAAERYREAFWGQPGQRAREYMKNRSYTDKTLEEFGIGFAPEGWRNLVKALKRDGYDLEDARDAGLIRSSDSGRVYDSFRKRIVFPIENLGGEVVAFGGRILDGEDEDVPKYLNSPDTPIFHKRKILYGLEKARGAIREHDRCLFMEGYTDVMMCHQEGYETAVATLGTALTEQHVDQVENYADEIVLVYDGDQSGRQAARKGGRIALTEGLDVSVVLMPDDADPADMLINDEDKFEELIDARQSFLEFFMDWMIQEHTLQDAQSKEKILEEFRPLIGAISSKVKREETVNWLADRLKLRADVVRDILKQSRESRRSRSPDDRGSDNRLKEQSGELIEEIFFRSLIQNQERFDEAVEILGPRDFGSKNNGILMKALVDLKESDRSFSGNDWMELVPEDQTSYLAGLLSWNEQSRLAEGTDPVEVARKIKRLDASQRERAELSRELANQDDATDAGRLDESKKILLEEVMNLKSREESGQSESLEGNP